MIVSDLVCSGAFSSSVGITEDERVKTSSLLLTKSQRDRIQARNQLATSRHVHHNRKSDENKSERRRNVTELQKKKTLKPKRSLDDTDKSIAEKPKLRDLKQKELIAKREYLRKLQEKEREVCSFNTPTILIAFQNTLILNISKSMLKHHQQILQKERKTAITLLSKIETVLTAESGAKIPEELIFPTTKRGFETDSSPIKQPIPDVSTTRSIAAISQQKSLSSPSQPSSSISIPFFTTPSRLSSADNQAVFQPPPVSHISNTVPFSAQPSLAEEDEESESSSQPDEIQRFHEEEKIESNSDHEPLLPPTAPKPSLMSKIWGMNADDFNEVSEGEWST
jgi:hypothetical protein